MAINTVNDLESALGEALRSRRIERRLTQAALAERANVSLGALKSLENAHGSTTTTLVKVIRALGQDEWIRHLAPSAPFNPLDLIEPRRLAPRRVRRRATP